MIVKYEHAHRDRRWARKGVLWMRVGASRDLYWSYAETKIRKYDLEFISKKISKDFLMTVTSSKD
ncbi:hypothetical protein GCM10028895_14370 [Pontibacter rugosus]